MNINSVAAQNSETGYGRMGRNILDALAVRGVKVDPCTSPMELPVTLPKIRGAPEDTVLPLRSDGPVHANGLWMGAPSHIRGFWQGQQVHCLTMWEATGVPPGFRENVHEIDTIIVPSQQNVELFQHWHDNVKKVPLGVNPEQWHYRPRPEIGREFKFLTTGQGPRKGIDIAANAFSRVFSGFRPSADRPIPTLTVKSRHKQEDVRGERITVQTGTVPAADEIEIYGQAHVFLGLARGEGWGLMPFQAMAQGCPTILSDAHGHHEFSHLASRAISCGLSKAEPFIFGDADQWWEPDFDETCEAIWDMYLHYEDYLGAAKHTSEVIADEYTWDDTARKLIEAMGGEDSLNQPDITERVWFEPTVQTFLIIANKGCKYEVNGTVYVFEKGEEYHEFGDLKRMMFENDDLDPLCLQDVHESGLTDDQLTRVERYKAQHSRCYACGQKYNSDTSLDFDDDDVQVLIP